MGAALLVVDVQNGDSEGVEGAAEVIATIASLVDDARAHGRPVVWVQHEDEDFPRDSHAWQIAAPLAPASGEVRVIKHHRSAFAGTGLADRLRALGVDRVVLTGIQSAFCVDMAGKHALAEGFGVTLVRDGHCNGPMITDAGEIPDAVVRALVNRTWSSLRHPDVEVAVLPASEVRW